MKQRFMPFPCAFRVLCGLLITVSAVGKYEPNWDSLITRPLPSWFDEAKIGIFLHWGVYSVPSYVNEWYWYFLDSARDPNVVSFHNRTYGYRFKYPEFGPMFTAELFNPDEWAKIFKDAGARYVVLTTKHHEGFTLWCSKESFNWNACDIGPKRNLVEDLTKSVRAAGLRMGLYHSMFEWYNPLFQEDKANDFNTRRYVDEVYYPQAVELNTLYKPDLLWSDGDGDGNSSYWRSPELLAWLYNDGVGTADTLVVNDRWGSDNPPISSGHHHGGYFNGDDGQSASPELLKHKWESAFAIDNGGWGYARNRNLDGLLHTRDLLHRIISAVAYGGNVLIDIGPTHDGRISLIFQQRLRDMGAWLQVNGEAIYSTVAWHAQNDTAGHGPRDGVYYTAGKGGSPVVYAHMMAWPQNGRLTLTQPVPTNGTIVRMLGCQKPMDFEPSPGGGIVVVIPPLTPPEIPLPEGPWVLSLSGVSWAGAMTRPDAHIESIVV